MKYSNNVIVNQYPQNFPSMELYGKINKYKRRNIVVGIIWTRNFLKRKLQLLDIFQSLFCLNKINPLIKKKRGIRNILKNSEYE